MNYSIIQADLLAIRNKIEAHFVGMSDASPSENWARRFEGPPSESAMALEENKMKVDLGHPIFDQVEFVKDDIGLKEQVVIRDYSSPPDNPYKHPSVNLSGDDILKCTRVCEVNY